MPGEFSHGNEMGKASRETCVIISVPGVCFVAQICKMNHNVLLDSTRNALVGFFQSLFTRKLLGLFFNVFVEITSYLSLYLCMI